jgi:hypothetical protein
MGYVAIRQGHYNKLKMLDFTELPKDGRAFEQLIREILLVMGLHPQWTGQGADQGRDIVATEELAGPLGTITQKWLVQCKHFAHGGDSVGRNHVGSFDSDCRQISANGYLLAVSTQPSSGLVTKLEELAEQSKTSLRIKIWDSVDIEKLLAETTHVFARASVLPKIICFDAMEALQLWFAQSLDRSL